MKLEYFSTFYLNFNKRGKGMYSSDWEKLLKFEGEGREITKLLGKFLVSECFFLTCSWRFLRYNKLE